MQESPTLLEEEELQEAVDLLPCPHRSWPGWPHVACLVLGDHHNGWSLNHGLADHGRCLMDDLWMFETQFLQLKGLIAAQLLQDGQEVVAGGVAQGGTKAGRCCGGARAAVVLAVAGLELGWSSQPPCTVDVRGR